MRPALVLAAVLVLSTPARAADDRPVTVPALRVWHATGGTFPARYSTRVIVRPRARRLLSGEARTLAEDLGSLLRRHVRVTARRGARARDGDIVLTTSTDTTLGNEGYALRIGRAFTVESSTTAGAFYGGRTLLQLLSEGTAIPRGRARDFPEEPERGLMIDVGRRFYPRAWLEDRIRQMASLKLNLLHLHLSDDQGYRIESPSHPEIVSPEHLTRDDVRALEAIARRDHVTIVPEIDMPGHMTAALAKHPELQLADAAGNRQPDKLDVTLDAARQFAADLVGDELALFTGPYVHVGADEFLGVESTPADYDRYPQLQAYAQRKYGPKANGHDAVQDFVNSLGDRIAGAGRTMRVWSDGIDGGSVVSLRPGAVVEWWENLHSPTPAELAAQGHPVLDVGWWPLYYVNGGTFGGLRAKEADAYEQWEPWRFEGPYTMRWITGQAEPPPELLPRDDPHLLGATEAVWNDDPTSPGGAPVALAAGITARLRIVAQKTWASPPLTNSYAEFERITSAIR